MNSEQLIEMICQAEKKTPLIALVQSRKPIPGSYNQIIFGSQNQILNRLQDQLEELENVTLFCLARNSAMDLLNIETLNARVEYGALIRDHVTIEDNAVIMMGAILNVGCFIGEKTMIDMGAVIGARAQVGKRCHIGANAVLAGVLEPPSAKEVVIEDEVLVGAGAIILEGVRVGHGAIVAAGAVVIEDVAAESVVAGCPAKMIKMKDKKTESKTQLMEALRKL